MNGDQMRVSVDFSRCDGNGLCAFEAPEVYELDENDELNILQEVVSGDALLASESAARMCPKQAITHAPVA